MKLQPDVCVLSCRNIGVTSIFKINEVIRAEVYFKILAVKAVLMELKSW